MEKFQPFAHSRKNENYNLEKKIFVWTFFVTDVNFDNRFLPSDFTSEYTRKKESVRKRDRLGWRLWENVIILRLLVFQLSSGDCAGERVCVLPAHTRHRHFSEWWWVTDDRRLTKKFEEKNLGNIKRSKKVCFFRICSKVCELLSTIVHHQTRVFLSERRKVWHLFTKLFQNNQEF